MSASTDHYHDVGLVVSVQVPHQVRKGVEVRRVKGEVFGLVHVVDVIPLDVLERESRYEQYTTLVIMCPMHHNQLFWIVMLVTRQAIFNVFF